MRTRSLNIISSYQFPTYFVQRSLSTYDRKARFGALVNICVVISLLLHEKKSPQAKMLLITARVSGGTLYADAK